MGGTLRVSCGGESEIDSRVLPRRGSEQLISIQRRLHTFWRFAYGWFQCLQAGGGWLAGLCHVVGRLCVCPVHVWIDRRHSEGPIRVGGARGHRYAGEPGEFCEAYGH